jgi:hypothetical protein
MHMDSTLDILSRVTTSLGNSFRIFVGKTCAAFQTRELEREQVARQRRQEKTAVRKASESSRKPKQLNLKTYKYHSLGDYVETIRRFGTTDSYSTQAVSIHLMSPARFRSMFLVRTRLNLSIEHRNPVTFGLVVDQSHNSYLGLKDDSAAST